MRWNQNVSLSTVIFCHLIYAALIVLLSCSSTFESAAKCETCRELVERFNEVIMLLVQLVLLKWVGDCFLSCFFDCVNFCVYLAVHIRLG